MKETILKEVISIRNRLGTIITEAEPKIGKDWVMFERIVAAHKNLRRIEIDKSTPMGDENQPMLPGTPPRIDNICPTCANFETCEFEIKKQGGVPDCEGYMLKVPEASTREITPIQDMPRSELSEEEKAKLTEIKQDVTQDPPESLASFKVDKVAEKEGEDNTVSMCGQSASHKTLRGAVIYLFQNLGFPCQTPDDLKEALLKFPESDQRSLIISFLEPDMQAEETKRKGRRKKTEE